MEIDWVDALLELAFTKPHLRNQPYVTRIMLITRDLKRYCDGMRTP